MDSEECAQTSQNGYIFTCPEPGNAVQHVNFALPNFLGEGGAGKMPAPKRSLSRTVYSLTTGGRKLKNDRRSDNRIIIINIINVITYYYYNCYY